MVTDNIQHFYCASVYPRTAQTYSYHGHRQVCTCQSSDSTNISYGHEQVCTCQSSDSTNIFIPWPQTTCARQVCTCRSILLEHTFLPWPQTTCAIQACTCRSSDSTNIFTFMPWPQTLCTCTIHVCTYRSDSTLSFAPYYCALAQTFKPWPQTTSTTFTAHISIPRQHRHVHLYTRVTDNFQHPLIVLPLPSALEHSSFTTMARNNSCHFHYSLPPTRVPPTTASSFHDQSHNAQ